MISRHVSLGDHDVRLHVHDSGHASIEFVARGYTVCAYGHIDNLDDLERVRDAINAVLAEARP